MLAVHVTSLITWKDLAQDGSLRIPVGGWQATILIVCLFYVAAVVFFLSTKSSKTMQTVIAAILLVVLTFVGVSSQIPGGWTTQTDLNNPTYIDVANVS